jgi:diguanylate cyclase (GGDEF)-like protein/PAS domain S-box-containing protein
LGFCAAEAEACWEKSLGPIRPSCQMMPSKPGPDTENLSDRTEPGTDPPARRLAIDALPDPVCVIDSRLRAADANDAFCALVGQSRSHLVGTPVRTLASEAGAKLEEALDRLRIGGCEHFDTRLSRADGGVLHLSVSATLTASPRGNLLVATFRDIGRHKQVEDALRASQARLAEAQRVARLGNWVWDIPSGIVWWSDEIYRIFGLRRQETDPTYDTFLGCVHPEDRQAVIDSVEAAVHQGRPYRIDHRVIRPDGSIVYVHEKGEITRENGRAVRMMGTVQDVSEHRRIEDDLQQQAQILGQIRDSIVSTDLDGVVTTWNRGAEKIFGYTAEEALGRHISFVYPDEERERLAKEVIAPLKARGSHEVEVRLRRKSGEDFYGLLSLSLLRDSHQQPVGMVGITIDITERKSTLDALKKLSRAVQQTVDMVMITDRNGVIEYVNPAFEACTGFSNNYVTGRRAGFNKSGRHDAAFYVHLWSTLLNGEPYRGILLNRRADGELFYEQVTISPLIDDAGEITHFISNGQDITNRVKDQEELEYLAHYDVLTDLPNRTLFHDRLNSALERHRRARTQVALLFLDLDRFKQINDTMGHVQGDEALKTVANRLKQTVRAADTVARLSGDEFAVILEDVKSPDDVAVAARKILEAVAGHLRLQEHNFYITASIGVSLFPRDGKDGESLLKHADVAMYRAKETGRNNFIFYSKDMSTNLFGRLTLESKLRVALESREFELRYQPLVSPQTRQICAVEALLRWNHRELGMVPPSEFIPVLEETGLIIPVGEWVFEEGFRQLVEWKSRYACPRKLAINLSAVQLNDRRLVETIQSTAETTGFHLEDLQLEITESVLVKRDAVTMNNLRALGEIGVRLAIDDFGTHYACLSYLQQFPIDTIKIDRSFITDVASNMKNAALVRGIIAMATNLNLRIVAEGVETRAQMAFLRKQECDQLQGYYLSRPLRAPQVLPLIRKSSSTRTEAPQHGRP